jgi:serine/threonine protein kinase
MTQKPPSQLDARIGRVLADRYRIDGLLGRGAMGVVYRGTHELLGGPIAVKFLHGPWAKLAEYRARFKREAQLLAKLRHPGLVSVLDYGEDEGTPYLVMELLVGRTLREEMRKGPLPFAKIVDVVGELLSVLSVAHREGVVHRDIKPENVMLLAEPDGGRVRVKLFDFGLAFANDQPEGKRLTEPNAIHGTPLYMSPEQCRARPVTAASDVYSVGVLLYEILCGATPFGGEGSTDVLAQQVFLEAPPMEERGSREVPVALEEVALEALAKRPEARPTVDALRARLLEAAAHAGVAR